MPDFSYQIHLLILLLPPFKLAKIRHLVSQLDLGGIVDFYHCDYCNVIFTALDKYSAIHLKSIQNITARLFTKSLKHAHITPGIYSLHWLSVEYIICFKILCYVLIYYIYSIIKFNMCAIK